ncbi:hypothetical protein Fmac_025100 [Flemingia macrophylla]|uniref:NET2A-D/KIP1-like alpha-helical domain-containing protein n=1 Tax=Flemingia macrophylla TaxID=520843 RepID=A0ABD1LR88_9FABA
MKSAAAAVAKVPKSGLRKKEAREEVQKLQKNIMALQTVKKFVKSYYDNSFLVFKDDDARHLMAETALKSCQEALIELQEKHKRSLDETIIEAKRELQLLKKNKEKHFETSSNPSLGVAEMANKIDGLVNKVISLKNAVSSQIAMLPGV